MMHKCFQTRSNEGSSTCAMYLLVLNQWEGMILSLLSRRGFPPPGEDKVDPTTFHHLKSHFSYLVPAANCPLLSLATFWDLKIVCPLFIPTYRPLHFKPFLFVFFLRYKKKNLSCLLSSVCLKTSFSSSLPGSAFADILIVLLIPPAGSFYQLQSREAEGAAIGRTWFQRWTFTGNHPIRDNTPERHARTRTSP
jgi:hypothetical protein